VGEEERAVGQGAAADVACPLLAEGILVGLVGEAEGRQQRIPFPAGRRHRGAADDGPLRRVHGHHLLVGGAENLDGAVINGDAAGAFADGNLVEHLAGR
jgi:hypothetical protein